MGKSGLLLNYPFVHENRRVSRSNIGKKTRFSVGKAPAGLVGVSVVGEQARALVHGRRDGHVGRALGVVDGRHRQRRAASGRPSVRQLLSIIHYSGERLRKHVGEEEAKR